MFPRQDVHDAVKRAAHERADPRAQTEQKLVSILKLLDKMHVTFALLFERGEVRGADERDALVAEQPGQDRSEIDRVLECQVHALPEDRRAGVRRVADQEQPVDGPVVDVRREDIE